jgi:hypothetical protein
MSNYQRKETNKSGGNLGRVASVATMFFALFVLYFEKSSFVQENVTFIIFTLLTLLAYDALAEKIIILDRLERRVNSLNSHVLRTKEDLPTIEEQGRNASEICIISPALMTIMNQADGFLKQKIEEKCVVKILLIDPTSESTIDNWKSLNDRADIENRIKDALHVLNEYRKIFKSNRCEIRIANVVFPFSMYATDINKITGCMAVEFQGYKAKRDLRPHAFLTAKDDAKWFKHYKEQFDLAWKNSEKWVSS